MPTVLLPRLLQPIIGSKTTVEVAGTTLGESIGDLLDRHPGLRPHLFDENGELRPHVLCFIDGRATRLLETSDVVAPTTEIRFLQAVSGG